jgi:hypothetical protein
MPYVNQELREKLKDNVEGVLTDIFHLTDDQIEGALNYVFTELLSSLQRGENGNWQYRYLNRAVGVLECCKLELYRRAAAPYEDKCIEKNGDVNIYKGVM